VLGEVFLVLALFDTSIPVLGDVFHSMISINYSNWILMLYFSEIRSWAGSWIILPQRGNVMSFSRKPPSPPVCIEYTPITGLRGGD
jgi:hypothetical protein